MDRFVVGFIRASLIWLGVGVALGVAMAYAPGAALGYRPAHMHANLLGFVSMMIFGVAYHVIPRFSGSPLRSRRMADIHLWVANVGLALLVAGFIARVHAPILSNPGIRGGAALAALGAYLFIFNLWRTLDSARRPAAAAPHPGSVKLPVAG
jgi:heme/copper-type cytochrome/quinol oxidase subunit 1